MAHSQQPDSVAPPVATAPVARLFRSPSREAWAVGVAVAAIYLVVSPAAGLIVGGLGDDGAYVTLGKAIATGKGYHSLHLIGAPPQLRFPPLFPAILALLWMIGGSVDAVQHAVSWIHPLVVGGVAALLWWTGRVALAAPRSVLALLVVVPLLLDASITYDSVALSEPWFMLAWAAALAAWSAAHRKGAPRTGWLVATGLSVAAAALARSQAITLVVLFASLCAHAVLAKRISLRVGGVALSAAILPLVPWMIWSAQAAPTSYAGTDEVAYAGWFGGIPPLGVIGPIAGKNLLEYTEDLGAYIAAGGTAGTAVAAMALIAMVALGAWAARRHTFVSLSALSALALLVVWPSPQDRLLLSVLPFAGLAAAAALAPLVARDAGRRFRMAAICSLLAAGALVRQFAVRSEAVRGLAEGRAPAYRTPLRILLANSRVIAELAVWARTVPDSERVVVDGNAGIYLYSGRATIPLSPTLNRLAPQLGDWPPGEYIAGRIVHDSATLIVSGPAFEMAREINTLDRRCPGTLTMSPMKPPAPFVAVRVGRERACISAIALGVRFDH